MYETIIVFVLVIECVVTRWLNKFYRKAQLCLWWQYKLYENISVVLECVVTRSNDSHVNYTIGDTANYPGTLSVTCDKGYKVNGSDNNADITAVLECLDTGVFNHTPFCEPKGKTSLCNSQQKQFNRLLTTVLYTLLLNCVHLYFLCWCK